MRLKRLLLPLSSLPIAKAKAKALVFPSLRRCKTVVEWRRLSLFSRFFLPVSQDWEFVHNNTKPLCRIAWHFWTNTKYSGEVSLIISVDIYRELTQCVRTWDWDFTVCPSSTVSSTFIPRQYLQSLEISKLVSCVLRGIKRAILTKLVKISDCRVSSFLKTVPGCRVSRHSDY